MKKIIISLFLFFISLSLYADNNGKFIVYYFHGDYRCPTCIKMEEYSREAIERNFKEQLNSGELVYKVVNTDEKANAHFVGDYQLYTKSLVLSFIRDGKEVKYKNLDKIWDYVGNKDQYMKYVTDEINKSLEEMK